MPVLLENNSSKSLERELGIVFAITLLLLKSETGRTGAKLLFTLVKPALMLCIMVPLWSLVGRSAPFGIEWSIFIATGLMTLTLYKSGAGSLMKSKNKIGKFTSLPVISELHYAVALLISETTILTISTVLVLTGIVMMGLGDPPDDVTRLLLILPAMMMFNFGHGLINHAMLVLSPRWKVVFLVMNRPLLILSGVLYMNETLPYHLAQIFAYMPSAQFIMWFRDAWFREYTSTNLSYSYVLQFSVIVLATGLTLQRVLRRKIRST